MPPDEGFAFSRESVLAGMPARRASTLLYAVESRTALLVARSRRAMARFETERTVDEQEQLFLAAMAAGRTPPVPVSIQDLDRHAREWADLLPPDAELRAALTARIATKYGLPAQARLLRTVLGADDPAVIEAYRRQSGKELAILGSGPLPIRERLRWRRTAISRWLEDLPPFWLAYALTLTETVGGGVLALPIAFARFGPVGATLVLLLFGVINALTVAALVESITRTGSMRYGSAYFGRLIGDRLGRPGNVVAMPALFALDAVGFLVALVGFGTTIGGAIGAPSVICAALLFGVVLAVIWRGSFDATVALAVAVGLVNLGLLAIITLMAAQSAGSGAIASEASVATGPGTSWLELIFGVALVAYFGHTSAGHAAKVVLARDPSGKQFMAGNIAAMMSAMVIYIAFVLAVTAAVGADTLEGYAGTALTPLAAKVGPIVDGLGTVYILLGVGLSAIYVGLGIYNQMDELLVALPFSIQRTRRGGRLTLFVLGAAPLVAIFVLVAVLLQAGDISFTEPLNIVGTLTLPLLGGVFPMLLLVASRRRGERLPGRLIGLLGHPVTALLIGGLYLFAVISFGLWIWQEPWQRAAALLVAAAMVAVTVVSWRRGVFVPRTVVEYRVEAGPPAHGIVSVVSSGRALVAHIELDEMGGRRRVEASEVVVSAPGRLRGISVTLPANAAPELELWIHAISSDGSSTATPSDVELVVADQVRKMRIDGHRHDPVIIPIDAQAPMVKITMAGSAAHP